MNDGYSLHALSREQRPLLARFYQHHGSRMRPASMAVGWVLRDAQREIVAALNLTPMANGQWLTGLYVAPHCRQAGLGSDLLHAVRRKVAGSIWLFCEPQLEPFYERRGWAVTADLPQPLEQRLTRYQQSKRLSAMVNGPIVPAPLPSVT